MSPRIDIALPAPHSAVGSYAMAVRTDDLMFLSGHGCFENGRPIHTGRLGADLTTTQGQQAARAVALNLLATIADQTGDLSHIAQIVKLVVFVNSTPDFAEQHLVANGATDLLLEVLGDAGRTARSAIGVASLPLGFAIEIEAVVRLA
jgi:enamine deaminase RidA (YjgF/YER057c/UK114 family)